MRKRTLDDVARAIGKYADKEAEKDRREREEALMRKEKEEKRYEKILEDVIPRIRDKCDNLKKTWSEFLESREAKQLRRCAKGLGHEYDTISLPSMCFVDGRVLIRTESGCGHEDLNWDINFKSTGLTLEERHQAKYAGGYSCTIGTFRDLEDLSHQRIIPYTGMMYVMQYGGLTDEENRSLATLRRRVVLALCSLKLLEWVEKDRIVSMMTEKYEQRLAEIEKLKASISKWKRTGVGRTKIR